MFPIARLHLFILHEKIVLLFFKRIQSLTSTAISKSFLSIVPLRLTSEIIKQKKRYSMSFVFVFFGREGGRGLVNECGDKGIL